MKADTALIRKASELGILRSLPDFLLEPLKPGRLKRYFNEVGIIIDSELQKIYRQNPNFFIDNKQELADYLDNFGRIVTWKKEVTHVGSVVAFCLAFLEDSTSTYPDKLYGSLMTILDYFERADNIKYSDFWKGGVFHEKWEALEKGE